MLPFLQGLPAKRPRLPFLVEMRRLFVREKINQRLFGIRQRVRWDPDWRAAWWRRSHSVQGVRHRVAGPEVVSKAGRKVCRCSGDAAQFGFGFGFGFAPALSRGTGRRGTVSDKVASRRNPAVPEVSLRHSGALPRLLSGTD